MTGTKKEKNATGWLVITGLQPLRCYPCRILPRLPQCNRYLIPRWSVGTSRSMLPPSNIFFRCCLCSDAPCRRVGCEGIHDGIPACFPGIVLSLRLWMGMAEAVNAWNGLFLPPGWLQRC